MKKNIIFTILLSILTFANLSAQELTVKSFTQKTNDLAASTNPRSDNNGTPCALVKVQLATPGAQFSPMVVGSVDYKLSEYYVYVAAGAKHLEIKHQNYLPLDVVFADYGIKSLESKMTYQLVITGVVISGQQPEAPKQQTGWLILNSEPSGADVYLKINGVESLEGQTPFQKKLAYGNYQYRLTKNLYHNETVSATVNAGKIEQTVTLKPAHGRLKITSNPSEAKVSIEGVRETYTTPCTTEILPSGQYRVTISKEKYLTLSKVVTVSDGSTTPVQFDLSANFAEIVIKSLKNAEIYLSGEYVGKTTYSAELTPGVYDFEARLASHRTVKKQVEVEANHSQTITLNPTPIYGSLDVISEPMNADITINNKSYGKTPNTIEHLLIGRYKVKLSLAGYASETVSVNIEEGKTAEIKKKLSNGREVTLTSFPSDAELFVDGKKIGSTPKTLTLTYGEHTIKAKNSENEVSEKIIVSANSSANIHHFELDGSKTFTVNGVSFKMIKVQGGTFTMGATSDQGSDAFNNEKPTHSVTLSSFSIGETEVTQALWQAVMGESISQIANRIGKSTYGVGSNYPMYYISWNDCQTFINKLNNLLSDQLGGKRFRMPTEAEWEYAARGGNKSRGYKYSGSNDINSVAWYTINSGNTTHAVKTKSPNELGLYDISGNVWEWCQDWYGNYSSSSQTNPKGPSSGSYRVFRGGYWANTPRNCRSSNRGNDGPDNRFNYLGLRLALSDVNINNTEYLSVNERNETNLMDDVETNSSPDASTAVAHQSHESNSSKTNNKTNRTTTSTKSTSGIGSEYYNSKGAFSSKSPTSTSVSSDNTSARSNTKASKSKNKSTNTNINTDTGAGTGATRTTFDNHNNGVHTVSVDTRSRTPITNSRTTSGSVSSGTSSTSTTKTNSTNGTIRTSSVTSTSNSSTRSSSSTSSSSRSTQLPTSRNSSSSSTSSSRSSSSYYPSSSRTSSSSSRSTSSSSSSRVYPSTSSRR